MSECKRFHSLKRNVELECEAHNIKRNATDYLVNKLAKVIKKSKFDIYRVYVSLFHFKDNGEHSVTRLTIPFHDGELFVTFIVD